MKMIKALFVVPMVLLLLPGAFATQPSSGSGTFTATSGPPHVRSAGGNMIITHSVMFTISGTISGTCTAQERDVMHANGISNFHGSCTLTGKIGDKSGTIVERYSGRGTMASFEGRFVGGQGTAGLAGMHVTGSFKGMSTGEGTIAGTYTLQWHIDPK